MFYIKGEKYYSRGDVIKEVERWLKEDIKEPVLKVLDTKNRIIIKYIRCYHCNGTGIVGYDSFGRKNLCERCYGKGVIDIVKERF